MRAVLVSSPGADPNPHWSHAAAGELAHLLRAGGARVDWLSVAYSGQNLAPAAPGVAVTRLKIGRLAPLHRVARCHGDAALELALVRSLRASPADIVVHLGVGARGSPNVLWLADCMGSMPIAVAAGAEVVCQRGTLVDAAGLACTQFDDVTRCRRCCASAWWSAPRRTDISNRTDLLVAGLAVATAVFVPVPTDLARLVAVGVPARRVVVDWRAATIAQHVLAAAVR